MEKILGGRKIVPLSSVEGAIKKGHIGVLKGERGTYPVFRLGNVLIIDLSPAEHPLQLVAVPETMKSPCCGAEVSTLVNEEEKEQLGLVMCKECGLTWLAEMVCCGEISRFVDKQKDKVLYSCYCRGCGRIWTNSAESRTKDDLAEMSGEKDLRYEYELLVKHLFGADFD